MSRRKETDTQKAMRLRMKVAFARLELAEAIRKLRRAELMLKNFKQSLRAPGRKR